MITLRDRNSLREELAKRRALGPVTFVPTMGNLHPGHLTLVREARARGATVVVSIFVNPMQFGANEDLASYPRTLEADQQALMAAGVDVLFFPSVEEMYPVPLAQQTRVEVPHVTALHCGASRPGHFVGVATVVCKLFNMVQPDIAVFGKKDFQQLLVIRRMVADLMMPVEIVGVDTVREADGLAMSSRNQYLSEEERKIAPQLRTRLLSLAQKIRDGEQDLRRLERSTAEQLNALGFESDYVAIVDTQTLLPAEAQAPYKVVLAAARLGKARLIDNIEL